MIHLDVLETPTSEDREAVLAALIEYNQEAGPPTSYATLAILLRDDEGTPIGGLWGRSMHDWLFVELLVVPRAFRGQGHGERLMSEAERIARERGCIGIWLDTFSFQAPGFYECLGFVRIGELADHPRGGARYFYARRLDA